MSLQDSVRFFADTNVGMKRDHNEDNYLVDKKLALFIVADGMGGHAAGEVASAMAVRTIHESIRNERTIIEDFGRGATGAARVTVKEVLNVLAFAVQTACRDIHCEAMRDPAKRGMGTTLSLVLVAGNRAFIAHVGDSRIYLVRNGVCQQLTDDHTVYNELIKRGKMPREQIERLAQKNAITRALGVYEQVEVDTLSLELLAGDQLLLASDGFHGYLQNEMELAQQLQELDGTAAVQSLVQLANTRGGKDNITVVLVRVGDDVSDDRERASKLALKREVLKGMPLFSSLTDREVLRVMQMAEVRGYEPGQVVIREGDRGDELFIVLSGTVGVTKGDAVLTTLGRGQHFGEMALIRRVPRSATVTSQDRSEVLVIRRADFFEILRTEHEMAVKLLWQFLGVLAERLDQTSRDLRTAREVIEAEDVTAEIFPLLDDDLLDEGRETLPDARFLS